MTLAYRIHKESENCWVVQNSSNGGATWNTMARFATEEEASSYYDFIE